MQSNSNRTCVSLFYSDHAEFEERFGDVNDIMLELHISTKLCPTDPDFLISNETDRIFMIYSYCQIDNPPINMPAVRILMDNFLLTLISIADHLNICEYLPKGYVLFYSDNPKIDLTIKYIRQHWHRFFRLKMPYVHLYEDQRKSSIQTFTQLYRKLYTDHSLLCSIGTKYLSFPVPPSRCSDIDLIYCTVLSSCLYCILLPYGYSTFNNFDLIK